VDIRNVSTKNTCSAQWQSKITENCLEAFINPKCDVRFTQYEAYNPSHSLHCQITQDLKVPVSDNHEQNPDVKFINDSRQLVTDSTTASCNNSQTWYTLCTDYTICNIFVQDSEYSPIWVTVQQRTASNLYNLPIHAGHFNYVQCKYILYIM